MNLANMTKVLKLWPGKSILGDFAEEGFLNIVGGCCGTTPQHISAISRRISGCKPRMIPEKDNYLHLSGLEPLKITENTNFVNNFT